MQKIIAIIFTFIICLNILGCGKVNNDDTNSFSTETPSNTETLKNNDMTNNDTANNEIPEDDTTNGIDEHDENELQISPPDNNTNISNQKKAEKVKFTSKEAYLDDSRRVKFLGLKEYKKVVGEQHTDKPKKGNIYLVLFLSIENTGNEEDYINYNYLSAKINGKNIDHTFLVNSPRNYPPIFEHVEAGKTIGGFIVWEVPDNWKTLNFTYNGWKDVDNISLSAKFTPKDLKNPIIYDSVDYQ